MAEDHGSDFGSRSAFAERMAFAVAQWELTVPPSLRDAFRGTFLRFASDHDRALATIEGLWSRHDRRQAFDESTGLARRQPFVDHVASLLGTCEHAGALGLLFLDLNGLKAINDRCGHDAGDRAIAAAGRIMRDAIRVDRRTDVVASTGADDLAVARHGGDEFLIALELGATGDLASVGRRLKQRIDDPTRQRAYGYSAPMPLSVSIGGVSCPRQTPPLLPHVMVRELIACADRQMYASKGDGQVHLAIGRFTTQLEIECELVAPAADDRPDVPPPADAAPLDAAHAPGEPEFVRSASAGTRR